MLLWCLLGLVVQVLHAPVFSIGWTLWLDYILQDAPLGGGSGASWEFLAMMNHGGCSLAGECGSIEESKNMKQPNYSCHFHIKNTSSWGLLKTFMKSLKCLQNADPFCENVIFSENKRFYQNRLVGNFSTSPSV